MSAVEFEEPNELPVGHKEAQYFDWDTLEDHEVDIPKTYMAQIINYSEQVYWETGLLPTTDKLAEDLGIALPVVQSTVRTERYVTALASRGIDWDNSTSGKVLTPKQLVVANLMLNMHDKRSEREKLELCGVSSQQYHAWLRQPQFQDYLSKRGEALFKSADHLAYKSLIRNVSQGDTRSLDLFFQMRKIHQPRLQVDINIDVILNSVVEIITRRVTDPEVLKLIATDLANVIDVTSEP